MMKGLLQGANLEHAQINMVVESGATVNYYAADSNVQWGSGSEEVATEDADTFEGNCFRNTSEFVRQNVQCVVDECYHGSAANLAQIEIAFFDHHLIQKRNAHTAFVKSLMAWGVIKVADERELKCIVSGIADKHKRLPKEGYKDWSKDYTNDKTACENIGRKLGPTIPYSR